MPLGLFKKKTQRIKLLTARCGSIPYKHPSGATEYHSFSQAVGEIVEVPSDEAQRMLAAGQCERAIRVRRLWEELSEREANALIAAGAAELVED